MINGGPESKQSLYASQSAPPAGEVAYRPLPSASDVDMAEASVNNNNQVKGPTAGGGNTVRFRPAPPGAAAGRRTGLGGGVLSRVWNQVTATKPMRVILAEDAEGHLERSLGLWDLLAIGIGGTVGSGIFVTTGLIAHVYAGPAVILSWFVGGAVCAISGMSYAEMSARLPSAGSTYAYVYYSMGELPAFVAGGLLTLEYGVSGAAVARSWGDKVAYAFHSMGVNNTQWVNYEHASMAAGVIQAASVALLLCGMSIGTKAINFVTVLKVCLVLFMIIAGATRFDSSLLDPLVPPAHEFLPNTEDVSNGLSEMPSFGVGGVMAGATQAFFGFVGFDEVCCMAAQAKDGQRIMPRAVLGTIAGATVLSASAALVLVGLVDYTVISSASGFASAFEAAGYGWAAIVTQIGELVTLPVVVLIAFLAQPQLFFAMAQDGLLPSIFAQTNRHKTLVWGTSLAGVAMTIIALCVPFTNLGDMISAGVLISFNMTNAALILTRLRALREKQQARKDAAATVEAEAAAAVATGGGASSQIPRRAAPRAGNASTSPASPGGGMASYGSLALAIYMVFSMIAAFLFRHSEAMDESSSSSSSPSVTAACAPIGSVCLQLPHNGTLTEGSDALLRAMNATPCCSPALCTADTSANEQVFRCQSAAGAGGEGSGKVATSTAIFAAAIAVVAFLALQASFFDAADEDSSSDSSGCCASACCCLGGKNKNKKKANMKSGAKPPAGLGQGQAGFGDGMPWDGVGGIDVSIDNPMIGEEEQKELQQGRRGITLKSGNSLPPLVAGSATAAGAAAGADADNGRGPAHFTAPLVPLLPCIGMALNFYLVSTMSALGLMLVFSFIALCVVLYFPYAYFNAASRDGWSRVRVGHAVRVLLSTGEFREKDRWMRPRANSI